MIISSIIQHPLAKHWEAGIYVEALDVHLFSGKFESKEFANHYSSEKLENFARNYIRKICNIHLEYCAYNKTTRYLSLCNVLTHSSIPEHLPEISSALKKWKLKEKNPLIDYNQAIKFLSDYGVYILINAGK